jgi:signal transduction histidine kinase
MRGLIDRFMPASLAGRLIGTVVLLAFFMSGVAVIVEVALLGARSGSGFVAAVRDSSVLATVLAGLVALCAGVLLGLVITSAVRKPVERMVDHVKSEGYRALDEAEYASDGVMQDPSLPIEFVELGAVVDELLGQLATRQAELRSAISAAEDAEEALAVVVDESLEAKILFEASRVRLANPAAALALGPSPEALAGQSLAEIFRGVLIRDEDGSRLDPAAVLERAFERPVTVILERADMVQRFYVLVATRLHDSPIERILLTARDVTEEMRLQRIRSEILELVSHDLRTPLSVVVGYLDLLRRPLSDCERTRAIDAAKRDTGRMADLLEDLLSATRAEELLAPAALLPVSLADVAEEVVASLAATHVSREILVDVRERAVVLGDERRLRQALVNLVTNAFKYSPTDSPVTVRLETDADRVLLSVVDHGPGVPDSERDHVFERFARLERTAKERPGVGLGLYIVRTIAENHGGSARVTATPGGGATFVIDLPAAGPGAD